MMMMVVMEVVVVRKDALKCVFESWFSKGGSEAIQAQEVGTVERLRWLVVM